MGHYRTVRTDTERAIEPVLEVEVPGPLARAVRPGAAAAREEFHRILAEAREVKERRFLGDRWPVSRVRFEHYFDGGSRATP
jgi:hypothetical protein